jgi:hypothetical protein
MSQNFEIRTRGQRLVETLVWNAAAGAVLAVMVLLLLGSLQWLDQIAPRRAPSQGLVEVIELARPANSRGSQMPALATVNRPSG